MIKEVLTSKGAAAITSDQWHVVHARFTDLHRKRPFVRDISSEHPDRDGCLQSARSLRAKLRAQASAVPVAEQDEVFVRPPGFKSLMSSKSRRSKPKPPA